VLFEMFPPLVRLQSWWFVWRLCFVSSSAIDVSKLAFFVLLGSLLSVAAGISLPLDGIGVTAGPATAAATSLGK
jgi:hypothetical protein